jgi:hypothetical protein
VADLYRYRVEDATPGVEWRSGWPGHLSGSRILHVPDGWASWACLTGEHRYHRTKQAAAVCASIILPRVESVQIVGGTLQLDPELLAGVRRG